MSAAADAARTRAYIRQRRVRARCTPTMASLSEPDWRGFVCDFPPLPFVEALRDDAARAAAGDPLQQWGDLSRMRFVLARWFAYDNDWSDSGAVHRALVHIANALAVATAEIAKKTPDGPAFLASPAVRAACLERAEEITAELNDAPDRRGFPADGGGEGPCVGPGEHGVEPLHPPGQPPPPPPPPEPGQPGGGE